jgi:hypothetical protein
MEERATPWDYLYRPLDKTIDQLEWLANQMRAPRIWS